VANTYQHRVAPFRLADPTKPGHRKILAIFLIDPIPSATNIPPQQSEWIFDALENARRDPKSLYFRLPPEISILIPDNPPDISMTRGEAEEYRLKLMKERTSFTQNREEELILSYSFNMCEH
jgi:hypothetical protein